MKMTELRAENESLKQQIQLLSQQKEGEKDTTAITDLKDKNKTLRKNVKDLKAEKTALSGKIQTLESDLSSKEQEQQGLKAELERVGQQLAELLDVHARTTSDVESLRAEQMALQEKAAQLPMFQAEIERLRRVETLCNEKTSQVTTLQALVEQRNQVLEETREKAAMDTAEFQDQKAKLSRDIETVRANFTTELQTHRQQSGEQIASLQSQNEGLTKKVAELTEKLKLVATHLQRQLSEKQKTTNQYDTIAKEYQGFKEKSEKQVNDLMGLLNKMASELDAARAAAPNPGTQPGKTDGGQPANAAVSPLADTQPPPRVQELQNQVAELDQLNADQASELAELAARVRRMDKALASPLGRLVSPLLGLNEK